MLVCRQIGDIAVHLLDLSGSGLYERREFHDHGLIARLLVGHFEITDHCRDAILNFGQSDLAPRSGAQLFVLVLHIHSSPDGDRLLAKEACVSKETHLIHHATARSCVSSAHWPTVFVKSLGLGRVTGSLRHGHLVAVECHFHVTDFRLNVCVPVFVHLLNGLGHDQIDIRRTYREVGSDGQLIGVLVPLFVTSDEVDRVLNGESGGSDASQ